METFVKLWITSNGKEMSVRLTQYTCKFITGILLQNKLEYIQKLLRRIKKFEGAMSITRKVLRLGNIPVMLKCIEQGIYGYSKAESGVIQTIVGICRDTLLVLFFMVDHVILMGRIGIVEGVNLKKLGRMGAILSFFACSFKLVYDAIDIARLKGRKYKENSHQIEQSRGHISVPGYTRVVYSRSVKDIMDWWLALIGTFNMDVSISFVGLLGVISSLAAMYPRIMELQLASKNRRTI